MKKHKKTIEETRDRDADLKTLADAFFRDLLCTTTRKGKDVIKFEPSALETDVSTVQFVLNEIEFDESICKECGSALNEDGEPSAEATEYAEGLWFDLTSFLEERWNALHAALEESEVCATCGCAVESIEDYDGPLVCESCDESEEEETDEGDSEDDSEDAEDICGECGYAVDDCDCDEDSEEEEEDETIDVECSECGANAFDCDCETCAGCGCDESECSCDDDDLECNECGILLDEDGTCSNCDEED